MTLDSGRLEQLSNGDISLEQAETILQKLGLTKGSGSSWNIPSFRLDLSRHVDLVEEIVRVHGFENIRSRHTGAFVEASDVDSSYDFQMQVKRQLAAQGLYEIQGMKLIAEDANDDLVAQLQDALPLRPLAQGDLIRVSLPLSEDHAILRPSLVPSLVATAALEPQAGSQITSFL